MLNVLIFIFVFGTYAVQPLDNFIPFTVMSALGGRALKRIFNCLCNTNTPYNSLTLAHNAPHSLATYN